MSKHVIFSRNANNTALTTERIQQLAPAAFSDTKHERLTDRYVPLHTSNLIPVMQDYGYSPVQAAQKRNRKSSAEHSAHMIAFAKTDLASLNADDIRPEIILYNSHDGSGSVKLFAGAFRFICSNGIVAGDGFQSRMYHNKSAMLGFEDMLRGTVEMLPTMMERISMLRNVQLSQASAYEMARRSVATRWDMYEAQETGVYATPTTVQQMLTVNRSGDEYMDAFTVFNRIQESVIRGKAFVKSLTKATPYGSMRKARPVNSVKENIRINTELWNIAEEIAAT
jgi:hypothetical protein